MYGMKWDEWIGCMAMAMAEKEKDAGQDLGSSSNPRRLAMEDYSMRQDVYNLLFRFSTHLLTTQPPGMYVCMYIFYVFYVCICIYICISFMYVCMSNIHTNPPNLSFDPRLSRLDNMLGGSRPKRKTRQKRPSNFDRWRWSYEVLLIWVLKVAATAHTVVDRSTNN